MEFATQRKAKEYIIAKIVSEAARKGIPLDDVERKMLYFSETDWTLPDMLTINAQFERDYDEEAYEEKILALATNHEQGLEPGSDEANAWFAAIEKLAEGDHYLQVLIGADSNEGEPLPSKGMDTTTRMLLIGMAGMLAAIVLIIVGVRLFGR